MKPWIETTAFHKDKERNDHRPCIYKIPGNLYVCCLAPDGEVTSAIGSTKEEAYRKWKAFCTKGIPL